MVERSSRAFLSAFAVVCLAPIGSSALPAPSYEVTLEKTSTFSSPGSFAVGDELGEISISPVPTTHSHVQGIGTSQSVIQYWFRVEGPTDGLAVPIEIDGVVEIDAGNAVFGPNLIWGVSAAISAQAFDGPVDPGLLFNEISNDVASVDCRPQSGGTITVSPPNLPTCPATHQQQSFALHLATVTGGDNRVTLRSSANNEESFAASFDSRVDPIVRFAPGFDSRGYRIVLSEGIENGGVVPEPGTAILIGVGLAGLSMRRRSRP